LFEEAVLALRIAAIGFFARSLAGVLNTPQVVRLRTQLNTALTTGAGICQSLSVVVVVLAGGTLVAVVTAVAGVALCALVAHAMVSFKLLPGLSQISVRRDLIRPLAKFGGAVVATALLGMLLVNAEKVVLAQLTSLTLVAYYAVAYQAALLLTMGPVAMAQWLLPAFVQLQVGSTPALQQRLYERALRVNLLCLAPLAAVLCGWAKPFLAVWAGPDFAQESTLPLYILVVGAAFSAMAQVPQSLLQASGRARLIATLQAVECVPYLLFAMLLGYWMGAVGVAISWVLLATINTIMLFVFAHRVTGLSATPGLTSSYWALAVVMLALPILTMGVADSLLVRAWATLISLASYAALVWARVLTIDERGWMLGTLLRQSRLVVPRVT
jgi:O-antigen/teichoic acid export membrane protein